LDQIDWKLAPKREKLPNKIYYGIRSGAQCYPNNI